MQRSLQIKPIDFEEHASVCVRFRRDSFVCSFGVDSFFEEAGPGGERYLEWTRARAARFPNGYVHAWIGGEIVGQMELQILEDPRIGYVSLFYLVEAMRGSGLGGELQRYALEFFRTQGVASAQLSVSPTNLRALGYYEKHGWRDLGPRPGRDFVHLMERDVPGVVGSELE